MRFALSAVSLALLIGSVQAHPGALDASGCHNDAKTGERHCHRTTAAPKAGRTPAGRESFSGKVVSVKDGDTIEVLRGRSAARIRLYGVDSPEKNQPFGSRAKVLTSQLVFGKDVSVAVMDQDRYGRLVAEVRLEDGRSLNQELVKNGLAWWYRQYAPHDRQLAALEEDARKAKRGLWADPQPLAPWLFRRKGREKAGEFGF